MKLDGIITLDQWRNLSERVGGNLFQDRTKLEAMRRIDRSFGSDVSWDKFCDLVTAEIEGKFVVAPTTEGKGLPEGTLPLAVSNTGADE